MNFSHLYRVSFYLMLLFATLVMSVDLPDHRFGMLYPLAVAVTGLVAFLTVDRDRSRGLPRVAADLLALISIGLSYIEYLADPFLMILALGHWLVYLQIILSFRPKSVSGDWLMFGLGLVQVLVGTVMSYGHQTGFMLLIWAVLALWVLGLFSLQRDAERARQLGSRPASGAPALAAPAEEAYPGLLTSSFVFSAFRVLLTTLALGGVIFLAMPRRGNQIRARAGESPAQHMTGFDEEVQLGQLGEILESDAIVMSIEMFDEKGKKVEPEGEPLWRGVTMAVYQKGRWHRQDVRGSTIPTIKPDVAALRGGQRPKGQIRQQIKLESNDSTVLFGLRPMMDATTGRRTGEPQLNALDGTIFISDRRPITLDYEVRSYRDAELPQPGENPPPANRLVTLLMIPEDLKDPLRAISDAVVERDVPAAQRGDKRAIARALESYLRDTGGFGYTLKLDVDDPTIDPILDFLKNRKQGHCEYFASALTLLLRSQRIPARMVNGFKGGDYNDIARLLSVRQKHAHSWVEAYLGNYEGPDRLPIWITLDPTPGRARDESVAKVGGYRRNFRQLSDLIRYVWVFYIVGYNAERQNAVLYEPIRQLAAEARKGFKLMGDWARNALAAARGVLHFDDAKSLFSVRGFLVAFVGFMMLYSAFVALAWLARRLGARFFGLGADAGPAAAGAAHYRRLVGMLGRLGLERKPPAETQAEFAARAARIIGKRGGSVEGVLDVPGLVVDAFYRSRFGQIELTPAQSDQLDRRLDDLETALGRAGA